MLMDKTRKLLKFNFIIPMLIFFQIKHEPINSH